MEDFTKIYGERIIELNGQITWQIHTTRLKKLLEHFENLTESKKGRKVFDNEIGAVLKQFFQSTADDDALILAKAATLLIKYSSKK